MKKIFLILSITTILLGCGPLKEVQDKAGQLVDDTKKSYNNVVDKTNEVIDKVNETKKDVEGKIEDVKNAAKEIQEAKDAIEKVAQ